MDSMYGSSLSPWHTYSLASLSLESETQFYTLMESGKRIQVRMCKSEILTSILQGGVHSQKGKQGYNIPADTLCIRHIFQSYSFSSLRVLRTWEQALVLFTR